MRSEKGNISKEEGTEEADVLRESVMRQTSRDLLLRRLEVNEEPQM
jgi:hypothetical protein